MKIYELLAALEADYYTGVPDSQLAPLCNYLLARYGIDPCRHVVAANEGAAVGLAAGHYLATGKYALVYLQNSGLGNIVNPVCSLIQEQVYAIPMVFIVGWRGQPGVKDEPQHIFQGQITRSLLDCLQIPHAVLGPATTSKQLDEMLICCRAQLAKKRQFAFLVEKGAFEEEERPRPRRDAPLSREQALCQVLNAAAGDALFVSTTGKLSRELYELRQKQDGGHGRDFLTVGSMGHSLMIAAGIAAARADHTVFCLDGDGAVLMHQGSMAVAASMRLSNLTHVLFNNAAHESVGGIPTVGDRIDFVQAAKAAGYRTACRTRTAQEICLCLREVAGQPGPHFLEIPVNLEVRGELGRPTSSPKQNKQELMQTLGVREAEE